MVKSLVNIFLFYALCFSYIGLNVSIDADLRYNLYEWKENSAQVKLVGLSLRKLFSDSKGDRLAIVLSSETEHNFQEYMLHQFYVNYKGPLGLWNISIGRRNLPYGLLYSFDPTRQLYYSSHPILTFDSDDGIIISGIFDRLDYAVSATLGHGHPNNIKLDYPRLFAGRVGFTMGSTDENSLGLSFIYGKMVHQHSSVMETTNKKAISVDLTFYFANLISRIETNTGFIDTNTFGSVFIVTDIALTPKIDLTSAFKLMREKGVYKDDMLFVGFSFTYGYLKIRGGYNYAFLQKPSHTLSFQLYYLYSFTI